MPVEEDYGKGGKRCTNPARKERKGIPQGAPLSPAAANLHMRRFALPRKVLGYAWRFLSGIVNYADDLCVLGKALAADMLAAVELLVVGHLNRTITGWANYFRLGHVSPAYSAVYQHTIRGRRQWLCRKHKVKSGKSVCF